MSGDRLYCLDGLIQSYRSSQYDVTQKAPAFILKMMQKELDYHRSIDKPEWIFLKLCGNNTDETDYRLIDHDVTSLCASLLNVQIINSLDLRYNKITDDGAITIANYLKKDQCLKELNLTGNDITGAGAQEIGRALQFNRTLEVLKLTGNSLDREGGIALAQALILNSTLRHLDVGGCNVEVSGATAFSTALRLNKTLEYFSMDRLILFTQQEEPIAKMGATIAINNTLKELHMARCGIRDFGAERLVEAFKQNKTLRVLDLNSNRIARDGGLAIARALRNKCPLTILDLSSNRIQCEGAIAIAEALKKDNQRLIVLYLQSNEIKQKGLCALADSLFYNESLLYIYLWGNEVQGEAAEAWAHLITIGRLREEATDVKPYKVDGVVSMAFADNASNHKGYRYAIPSWDGQTAEIRSMALF